MVKVPDLQKEDSVNRVASTKFKRKPCFLLFNVSPVMGCFDKEPRKAGPLIDLGLRPSTFSSPEQIFSLNVNSFVCLFLTLTLWIILPSLVCAQSCSPPWPWQVAISTWWERLSAIQGLRKIIKKIEKGCWYSQRLPAVWELRKIVNKLR